MKLKSAQSTSMKSIRSSRSQGESLSRDKALEFDQLITEACDKYDVSRRTIVKKDFRVDEYSISKPSDTIQLKRKNTQNLQIMSPTEKTDKSEHKSTSEVFEDDVTVITAIYDNMNKLDEIMLHKQKYVSRKLIQIIGLITPLYQELRKITLKRCILNAYTMYEMGKFLPKSSITEVCLDDSSCLQSNYILLFNKPCRLVSMSLCRCNIDDNTCIEIASKLHYDESAESTLSALNLSSNHITDVGAKALGEALRTNRHLRYLNLAGNRITDDGGNRILAALTDFELTADEIINKRRRYMEYLKIRQLAYLRYFAGLDAKSVDEMSVVSKKSQSRKVISKSKKEIVKSGGTDDVMRRADDAVRVIVGPFRYPFNASSTKLVDGVSHCLGNMVLCYLDVSYNNLSYIFVKKLHSVLLYQSSSKNQGQVGLIRVGIDGNKLPDSYSCPEFNSIESLLMKNIITLSPRLNYGEGRKSKGRISVQKKN